MPKPLQWVNALATPRSVTIESSPELLASIQKKQAQKNARLLATGHSPALWKGPLAAVSKFAPTLAVRQVPIHLLHRLGVVTTPVVRNLADISSTWAYIC